MAWREITEKIRRANPIDEVLEDDGIDLRRTGKGWVCLCPLPDHHETKASFSVSGDGRLFFCFGCQRGGDVFKLVELLDNCDFVAARKKLATRAGLKVPTEKGRTEGMNPERRAEILNLAVAYYQNSLDDRVRRYLKRTRGLSNETTGQFRIGYAPSRKGLLRYLHKHGVKAREALDLGLLFRTASGLRPAFRERIVFPISRAGKTQSLIGRVLPGSRLAKTDAPKYLKLRKPNDESQRPAFFGEDTIKRGQPLIITEGLFDALLASQAGFATLATAGLHVSERDLPHLAKLCEKAGTTFLVNDAESSGAGAKGAAALGEALWDRGVRVRVGELPLAKGQKKLDLAEFIQAKGEDAKAALAELLESAPEWLEWQIMRIPRDTGGRDLQRLLRPLLVHVGKLQGIDREQYLKHVRKRFGLTLGAIEEEIELAVAHQQEAEDRSPKPLLTQADREGALELLKRPSLLFDLGQLADRLGVVGEKKNRLLLYLALTSRLLPDPVSVLLKGQSSGGKSFLAGTIYKLFPEEEVIVWSGMSSKALIYTQRDYRHKGLVFLERKGAEAAQESIRYLQSEKVLVYEVTVKNPKTGEYETKQYTHEGPIACVTTTTQASVEVDDENRSFSISPDESQAQTRRILAGTLAQRQAGGDSQRPTADDLAAWHNAQRVLAERPVKIVCPPWFSHVREALPVRYVRIRRDWPRLLAVCDAVALLHQYQRQPAEAKDGPPTITVTLADYAMARVVVEEALRRTLFALPLNTQRIVEALRRRYRRTGKPVTYRNLMDDTGMSYDAVYKWARPARDGGYIKYTGETSKANLKYMAPGKMLDKARLLPRVKDILRLHSELGQCTFVHPLTGKEVRVKPPAGAAKAKKAEPRREP